MDTESVEMHGQQNQPALIQIQMIKRPSVILLFEVLHLPSPQSHKFQLIKELIATIFSSHKSMYGWGKKQELYSFIEFGIITSEQINRVQYYDQQEIFTIEWRLTHPHHPLASHPQISLQNAILLMTGKCLNKNLTRSNFGMGLDPTLRRYTTYERSVQSSLIKYACCDCLAIETIIEALKNPQAPQLTSESCDPTTDSETEDELRPTASSSSVLAGFSSPPKLPQQQQQNESLVTHPEYDQISEDELQTTDRLVLTDRVVTIEPMEQENQPSTPLNILKNPDLWQSISDSETEDPPATPPPPTVNTTTQTAVPYRLIPIKQYKPYSSTSIDPPTTANISSQPSIVPFEQTNFIVRLPEKSPVLSSTSPSQQISATSEPSSSSVPPSTSATSKRKRKDTRSKAHRQRDNRRKELKRRARAYTYEVIRR
ncbi:unnamed protein product, partial [Didymodactylos carnosus]